MLRLPRTCLCECVLCVLCAQVKFVGEEGVDEGGVQKEFFQLLVRLARTHVISSLRNEPPRLSFTGSLDSADASG